MSAGQGEKDLLHYCPERELPDEIKQLPKDEVVCKFCGVSYLIHHEIKELQKRLQYLEACSSQLEEYKVREKKLLQNLKEEKVTIESQNAELNKSHDEITGLKASLQQVSSCIQDKDIQLKEKSILLNNLKKHLSKALSIHMVNLTAIKTDFSAAHKQVQLLSQSHIDIITSVRVRLKQRLVKEEASSVENISQLNSQCTQLSEDKRRSEAENKKLVSVIQQMESQCKQLEKANKTTASELEGKLNELNKQLVQSRNDLTAEKLVREDLECKIRASKSENSRLTKLLSDKTMKYVEETERLQSKNNQLEIKLQSAEEELGRMQMEYNNVVKDHYNTKAASNEAFEIERREKEQLLKNRELMIESHQNRLQELQEHFKAEKQRLESELIEKQKMSVAELDQLKRKMETKLTTELSKASNAADKEQEKLIKSKAAAIQQLENKLNRLTEKNSREVTELKDQLRVKQLENDAELTAHIHQVKELELKLKQVTDDAISRKRSQDCVARGIQVDSITEQLTLLEDQLQLQYSQCTKLNEELEKSSKEVEHLQNTVHLECKERIELTEALEQAREQLLAYKIKDKPTTVRSISASPVPPQQGYHGNTLSSLNHSRQRIAQITGRVSKTDQRYTKSGRF